jgi:hypothetical protein
MPRAGPYLAFALFLWTDIPTEKDKKEVPTI